MSRHRTSRKLLGPRAKSTSVKALRAQQRAADGLQRHRDVKDIDQHQRPQTRGDCHGDVRPCPWVSCKHHLYLDINPETGTVKINFPDLEPWELQQTCSLDVAERGGVTLEEVGEIMNLTRERIRQVEVRGLLKLKGNRTIGEASGDENAKDTNLLEALKQDD